MDKNKALEKIKKCLALSQSANENEAAQALKHAQALMAQYGLNQVDVDLSEISEVSRPAAKTRNLPDWHWQLIHTVSHAFGVNDFFQAGCAVFVGPAHRAEIAAYAYEVLLRQLQAARRRYMADTLKYVRPRSAKIYRADAFCIGWVQTVSGMVSEFAMTTHEKGLIERHMSRYEIQEAPDRKRHADGYTQLMAAADYRIGRDAGKSAQLHHAMGGEAETARQLEQPS